MMGRSNILARDYNVDRQRPAKPVSRRSRFLLIAAVLSVAIHLIAALLIAFLPRVLPRESVPKEPGTVELLMVEKKGAQPGQAGQPSETKPAPLSPRQTEPPKPEKLSQESAKTEAPKADPPTADKPKTETEKPVERAPAEEPAPTLPAAEHGDEPPPPPVATAQPESPLPPAAKMQPEPAHADPPPPSKQAEAKTEPAPPPAGPVFDLAGTESESNAIVMGGHVLPASPDDRFRNRPPVYPMEAQIRNEHGTVVVLIHVGENGLPTGADVIQSSGVRVLDEAAIAAVRKWHFRPALKEGRGVPFDFPFQFIFEPY